MHFYYIQECKNNLKFQNTLNSSSLKNSKALIFLNLMFNNIMYFLYTCENTLRDGESASGVAMCME